MRASRLLLLSSALVLLVACSDSDDTTAPVTPTSGGLDVAVAGLPDGVAADVEVRGPDGYSQSLIGSQTLQGLTPGAYTVESRDVTDGERNYSPSPAQQSVTVSAGDPYAVSVDYVASVSRGRLAVTVSGLPAGADADISIVGPDGFAASLSRSDTLTSLEAGLYTVTAAAVTHQSTEYIPFPEEEEIDVVAGSVGGSFISYGEQSASTLDFFVDSFEITQATQTETNSVPLIRDRAAYLRVWGLANENNTSVPDIRVDFYINGALQQSQTLRRVALTTPRSKDRGTLGASWNAVVPADLVQPNLALRFEIDPENAIDEELESNNRFPADGATTPVSVTAMAPMPVRLVPVLQSVNDLQGDADERNAADYVSFAEKLFPFPSVDVDVRSVYTSSAPELKANGENWAEVLQEILAVRNVTDTSDRYYYGVVQTSYSSGVAGLGYVPSSRSQGFNVAVGWDRANSRGRVAAHEMGHNLGRPHSPCGGPSNPDPEYPYARASIGQYGVDVINETLMAPGEYTDLMGYCNPQWISDYSYEEIRAFSGGFTRPASSPTTCLLVWGRIEDGEIVLEPIFRVQSRPYLPQHRGDYEVVARDENGQEVFSIRFDPPVLADHPTQSEGPFAFTVPVTEDAASQLSTVEIESRGRRAVQMRRDTAGTARRVPYFVSRVAPGRARVEWDVELHPVVMVRDGESGDVLSFARGGSMEFHAETSRLELWLSDGVRSQMHEVRLD